MPETATLADHLEGFARARVLCLGDLMLDRYVLGTVARISPEAPIPIIRVTDEYAELGGAGNVARNVAALGGRAILIAVVGADSAGREIARLIDAEPRLDGRLVVAADRPTTVKRRYIAAGKYDGARVDRDKTAPARWSGLARSGFGSMNHRD